MEDRLTKLVQWVDSAEEATQDSRDLSEKCRDYYDGKQLTDSEIAVYKKRKQPPIANNRIKPKIDFLLGLEAQGRTDPKAFPRTPEHEDSASAATDSIRYVCDNQLFDRKGASVFKNLCIEGTGGAEVGVTYKGQEPEIVIKYHQWDRLIYDPYSRSEDFEDAKYLGGVVWMDIDDAKAKFGDKAKDLEAIINDPGSETYDDVPRKWVDGKRKRVKICLLYWKDKSWKYAWFTKGKYLTEEKDSPYLDEDGSPECPLVFQSANVDREGNRYGPTRQFLDIQDEINKRRSKALHLMSVRQTWSTKGAAGENIAQLKAELAKADGHLEFEFGEFGKDFGVLPTSDMAQAQFELLNEAKQEIDSVGVNAAMSGTETRAMSGRALQTRQQGGSIELVSLFDSYKAFKQRIYRQVWNRIRQYWKEEKWVRVTDDENNLKWVGLNRNITWRDISEQTGEEIPPSLVNDPRLDEVAKVENPVAELDVDIIIDETPDVVSLRHETLEYLMQAVQASGQPVQLDVLIELMPGFPEKQKVLEKLRGGDSPEQQQAVQQQQEMQQRGMAVKIAGEEADVENTQADTAKKQADVMKLKAELASMLGM